ncbi:MAG: dienelactone hydrolase family protein [Burkholderiales bacterium]
MGQTIRLTAADGHQLGAYRADPVGKPRGAIIVIQEIFGVNQHIRKVADGYAAEGYVAIAPALFDRIRPGIEVGYSMSEIQEGFGYKSASTTENALADIRAAVAEGAKAGRVGVVGYCWGGFLSWMSASQVSGIAASAPYYGGGIPDAVSETPRCPVMMHFGEKDSYIPMDGVVKVRAQHPQHAVHVYDADHGFNCDERGSWHAPSAQLARERTLAFFRQHIG